MELKWTEAANTGWQDGAIVVRAQRIATIQTVDENGAPAKCM